MSNNNQAANTQNTQLELYTYKDIAPILGIGFQSARALMKNPDFPSFKIGTRVFVKVEDFNKWVSELAGKEFKINIQNDDE